MSPLICTLNTVPVVPGVHAPPVKASLIVTNPLAELYVTEEQAIGVLELVYTNKF